MDITKRVEFTKAECNALLRCAIEAAGKGAIGLPLADEEVVVKIRDWGTAEVEIVKKETRERAEFNNTEGTDK